MSGCMQTRAEDSAPDHCMKLTFVYNVDEGEGEISVRG